MTDSPNRLQAIELWEQGYALQARRELDGAIDCYRRSIEVCPTAEAHTFLGWALSWKGEVDAAIAECEKAIAVDPEFGNPYNDIGAYLIELGRPEEAIEWLERAQRAERYEPRHFPHLNLGRVYTAQGKITRAIEELERALEIAPGDPAALQALGHLRKLN
jgi:tetratricopeptide (TPR) repeat protein